MTTKGICTFTDNDGREHRVVVSWAERRLFISKQWEEKGLFVVAERSLVEVKYCHGHKSFTGKHDAQVQIRSKVHAFGCVVEAMCLLVAAGALTLQRDCRAIA